MAEINYSIIIPHKNIPELLQRCLNSIPRRDDIQVIVVDDNSDPDKVDFEHFPGLGEKCVEVYFTKEGKGAGYARNVGLQHVKGKWLLFADADDFFNSCFLSAVDKHLNSYYDIIYFAVNSVFSATLAPSNRCNPHNQILEDALARNDYNLLRYYKYEPWGKMIKTSLVKKNHLNFEETFVSNDVRFSIILGYFAKNISVDLLPIYCVTVRRGSLIFLINKRNIDTRLAVACGINSFLREKGLLMYRFNICCYLYTYFRFGMRPFFHFLIILFKHYKGVPHLMFIDIGKFITSTMKQKMITSTL